MGILIKNEDKIVCQGITGKSGTFHIKKSLGYGTNIVAGVTPGKGGSLHLGLPIFNTVKEAVNIFGVSVSIIFVPAPFAKDSILEAIFSGIKTIVCITEGIPVMDMLVVKFYLNLYNVLFVGPNSPGLVIPNLSRLGIMPVDIHLNGVVGIVSRSGTLTYEAIMQTSKVKLGQSTSVGIGGDPIIGLGFVEILDLFEKDVNTKIILMIGEIGGNAEEKAVEIIKKMKKPVVAYIAGLSAPKGKKMGHAGAIISGNIGGALSKIKLLNECGVTIVDSVTDIGKNILSVHNKRYSA